MCVMTGTTQPASTAVSSTATLPTTTPGAVADLALDDTTPPPAGGDSHVGAAIGAAIGVSIAVIALALVAAWHFRRHSDGHAMAFERGYEPATPPKALLQAHSVGSQPDAALAKAQRPLPSPIPGYDGLADVGRAILSPLCDGSPGGGNERAHLYEDIEFARRQRDIANSKRAQPAALPNNWYEAPPSEPQQESRGEAEREPSPTHIVGMSARPSSSSLFYASFADVTAKEVVV